jgi:hypothetical protein
MKAGHRRRRPTTTGGIKDKRSSHEAPHRDTTGSANRVRSHRAGRDERMRGLPLAPRSEALRATAGPGPRRSVAWSRTRVRPARRLRAPDSSSFERAAQLGQVVVPLHDDLDRSTVEHRRRDSLKRHPQLLDQAVSLLLIHVLAPPAQGLTVSRRVRGLAQPAWTEPPLNMPVSEAQVHHGQCLRADAALCPLGGDSNKGPNAQHLRSRILHGTNSIRSNASGPSQEAAALERLAAAVAMDEEETAAYSGVPHGKQCPRRGWAG